MRPTTSAYQGRSATQAGRAARRQRQLLGSGRRWWRLWPVLGDLRRFRCRFGCGKAECAPGCDCDRFSEVYNIVFPQYNQLPDGRREPLKNRGIDTGMGMERLAMVSQKKKTIFETDLFAPIVKATAKMLNIERTDENRTMLYVAADHARALTFAIADGVIPSNEARGYILRSILRRALLFAIDKEWWSPSCTRFQARSWSWCASGIRKSWPSASRRPSSSSRKRNDSCARSTPGSNAGRASWSSTSVMA